MQFKELNKKYYYALGNKIFQMEWEGYFWASQRCEGYFG